MKKGLFSARARIPYPDRIRSLEDLSRRSSSFLQHTALVLFMTAVCSTCDYASLFDLFDQLLNQSEFLGKIVTVTIAVTENVLPLLIVHLLIQHKYQPHIHPAAPVLLLSAVLAAFFIFIFYVRWLSAPFIFDMAGVTEDEFAARQAANQAANLLLSILPVVTSSVTGFLAYIGPSVYDKRYNALLRRILQEEQMAAEIRAAISLHKDIISRRKEMELENEKAYQAKLREIDALFFNMKEYALLKLAAHAHNPDIISCSKHLCIHGHSNDSPKGIT